MKKYKLGVIGGGNMCEAILRGVINGGFLLPDVIIVSDPSEKRRDVLARELLVKCVCDNASVAACSHVLLAVKPQVIQNVLDEIQSSIGDDALIVSIIAGVTSATISAKLPENTRVIRVMPNTPALAGAGMSAVSAGPGATDNDITWARRLLDTCGASVVVDESMMDAVTAVSGSGPAYFFYLVEAMIEAGVKEGLDRDIAIQLARQTCLGAGLLMTQTGEDPAILRCKVTSPGGTTQKAIETVDNTNVKKLLVEAICAAAKKSRELEK